MNLPEIDLRNWPEYFCVLFAVLGFLISLFTRPSAFLTYVIFLLFGFVAGRLWWQQRRNFRMSWAVIIIGFIAGYLLGAPHGSVITMLIVFFLGMFAVYYLHDKGHIKTAEY